MMAECAMPLLAINNTTNSSNNNNNDADSKTTPIVQPPADVDMDSQNSTPTAPAQPTTSTSSSGGGCRFAHCSRTQTVYVVDSECRPAEVPTDAQPYGGRLDYTPGRVVHVRHGNSCTDVYAVRALGGTDGTDSTASPSSSSSSTLLRLCANCRQCYADYAGFGEHVNSEHAFAPALAPDNQLRLVFVNGSLWQLEPAGEDEVDDDGDSRMGAASAADDQLQMAHDLSMPKSDLQPIRMATQQQPASQSPSTSLSLCPAHPDGKPAGQECMTCDLSVAASLSSQRLATSSNSRSNTPQSSHSSTNNAAATATTNSNNNGNGLQLMINQHSNLAAARNSCKTLKCPKCNWHYKYQETLEIHMKEKHSDEEITCAYCLSNRPHPKLARGETYSCGYKPYRCDICKYSTTTKGNLSIHMQSDKHLNNVHELQAGNAMIDPSSLIHADPPATAPATVGAVVASKFNQSAPSSSTPTPSTPPTANSSGSAQGVTSTGGTGGQQTFRCEVCMYETNIARNLRIHMQSDKHTQNMIVLQNKYAVGAAALMSANAAAAAVAAGSTNAGSRAIHNATPPEPIDAAYLPLVAACNAQLYTALQSNPANARLLQCAVCVCFGADSLSALVAHADQERSQPNASDRSMIAGNYYCNLCQYKTHLKANFQLHTKTDKHAQKLQLVNHMREGGTANEARARIMSAQGATVNSVHVRCNACNQLFTNWHKLELHLHSTRHKCAAMALALVKAVDLAHTDWLLGCRLCGDAVHSQKSDMIAHMHDLEHVQKLTAFIEAQGGQLCDFVRLTDANGFDCDAVNEATGSSNSDDQGIESAACRWCRVTTGSLAELMDHISSTHAQLHADEQTAAARATPDTTTTTSCSDRAEASSSQVACPLCKHMNDAQWPALQAHFVQAHKVAADMLPGLIEPLLAEAAQAAQQCHECQAQFPNADELYAHERSTGHVRRRPCTRSGQLGYRCWSADCPHWFHTKHALQTHYDALHGVDTTEARTTSHQHECAECCAAFGSAQQLQQHTAVHTVRNQTRCVLCEQSFDSTQSLRRHVALSHAGNGNGSCDNSASTNGGLLLASDGAELFTDEDSLNTQEMAEAAYGSTDRPFKCDKCRVAYTKQGFLNSHYRSAAHRTLSLSNSGSTQSMEKYLDPSRPHKCDICKESFTQRTILQVHFNSVGHLAKTKKLLDSHSPNALPEMQSALKDLVASASVEVQPTGPENVAHSQQQQQQRPYKCNLCKHASTQASTFEIHLRSVGHQNRMQRLNEILVAGELDMSTPVIEHPGDIKVASGVAGLADISNLTAAALLASLFTAQMMAQQPQQQQQQQQIDTSTTKPATSDETTSSNTGTSRTGRAFKRLLENYGFDIVMQFNEYQLQRKRKSGGDGDNAEETTADGQEPAAKQPKLEVADDDAMVADLPEFGRYSCAECSKSFSSIWVLKAHVEEVHQMDAVPSDELDKITQELQDAYAKQGGQAKANGDDSGKPVDQTTMESSTSKKSTSTTSWAGSNQQQQQDVPTSSAAASLLAAAGISLDQQQALMQQQQQYAALEQLMQLSKATGMNGGQMGAAANAGLNPAVWMSMMAAMSGMGAAPFSNPFGGLPNPLMLAAAMQAATSTSGNMNPFLPSPIEAPNVPNGSGGGPSSGSMDQSGGGGGGPSHPLGSSVSMQSSQSPQRRARTRITDDQLKILREYFDINNSPTEQQILEMSSKSGLPQKVIKHWFRNTLFKERQKSKDSPYNFNIPPSMGIDLDTYEKTGETRVTMLNSDEISNSTPLDSKPIKQELDSVKQEPMDVAANPNGMMSAQDALRRLSSQQQRQQQQQQQPQPQLNNNNNTGNNNNSGGSGQQGNSLQNALNLLLAASANQQQVAQTSNANQADPQDTGDASPATVDTVINNVLSASGLQQQQQQPHPGQPYPSATPTGSGRRANRTRFTDFQLKCLQEFFEKQAYPKDDDLEYLSKKMQLSPRVIVVWFQNARQKARKVFEAGGGVDCKAGTFDCKRCAQTFTRYYELIQHQQKSCFKSSMSGGAGADGLMLGTGLDDDDKDDDSNSTYETSANLTSGAGGAGSSSSSSYQCSLCQAQFTDAGSLDEHKMNVHNVCDPEPPSDALKIDLTPSATTASSSTTTGAASEFRKCCPYCSVTVHSRPAMEHHLNRKHASMSKLVDIDALPNIVDQKSASPKTSTTTQQQQQQQQQQESGSSLVNDSQQQFLNTLLLQQLANQQQHNSGGSTVNGNGTSDNSTQQQQTAMEFLRRLSQQQQQEGGSNSRMAPSPSQHSDEIDEGDYDGNESMTYSHDDMDDSAGGSPSSARQLASPNCNSGSSNGGGGKRMAHSSSSGAFPNPQANNTHRGANSKRFRTHLTPMQVQVMKFVFTDYKTPSMAECEQLGGEIGLHKRVVQVWFQNARAKERKAKVPGGSGSGSGSDSAQPTPVECSLCNVKYTGKQAATMQDHIFTADHVVKVRSYLKAQGVEDNLNAGSSIQPNRTASATAFHSSNSSQHQNQNSFSGGGGGLDKKAKRASSIEMSINSVASNPSIGDAGNADIGSTSDSVVNGNSSSTTAGGMAAYNLMLAAAASGTGSMPTMPGGMPMYLDTTLLGTPVAMLQIPSAVMQQIVQAMQRSSQQQVTFTQDGRQLADLANTLGQDDSRCLKPHDMQVGWACRKCSTVFQSAQLYHNHQQAICHSAEGAFKLVQTHYACAPCDQRFGKQDEFKEHCKHKEHLDNRNRL